jgi:adenine phosphoribosyltransferase
MWWNWVVMNLEAALSFIRDIPDYPKPGILFKDITPLLANSEAFGTVIDAFAAEVQTSEIIAGIEARGFIFAAAIASQTHRGFVPFRKSGKLPYKTYGAKYGLEYGDDEIEVHVDSFSGGKTITIVDDVLATGGTICAALELAERAGAKVESVLVLFEIAGLGGRQQLAAKYPNVEIRSLVTS